MNIPLPALAVEPVRIKSPIEALKDVLALKDALQAGELGKAQIEGTRLENDSRRRAFESEGAVRDVYAEAERTGQHPSEAAVMKVAGPKLGAEILQSGRLLEESRGRLRKLQDEHEAASLDYMGSMAAAVKASGYKPEAMEAMLQQAESAGHGEGVNLVRAAIEKDPNAIVGIVDRTLAASEKQRGLASREENAGARVLQSRTGAERLEVETPKTEAQGETAQRKLDALKDAKPEDYLALVDELLPVGQRLRVKSEVGFYVRHGNLQAAERALRLAVDRSQAKPDAATRRVSADRDRAVAFESARREVFAKLQEPRRVPGTGPRKSSGTVIDEWLDANGADLAGRGVDTAKLRSALVKAFEVK